MRARPALKILVLLALGFSFLCLTSSVTYVQAQSRSGKNSARKLMDEMSESEDDGFDVKSDSKSKKDRKNKEGSKKSKTSEKSKKSKTSEKAEKTKKPVPVKQKNTAGKKGKGKDVEPVEEDTRTPEEKERDRMAYYHETGIWLWPELTDEQFEAEIQRQKNYLEEIKAKFPGTVYYESEHFFYLTNAPKPIAEECLKYLEAMFARLCQMFDFPKDAKVWKGKCIVCAFATQQQFLMFEQEFFHSNQFTGACGLAHTSSDGSVLISLYYGDISKMDKRWQFIGVLVHETTHGFVHRYRARQGIPLWLNEGMADFMAGVIVPADSQCRLKQQSGLNKMRQTGSVGGLFQADSQLEVWQYGVASGLVGFIFKSKPHGFKKFLDEIKDGKDWTEALKDNYNCTPEELLIQFGRANRIPMLRF
ncbi:MAG: basic secretory family protein [Thermoguttaceae bacterium]|nr:basic secretory family protein [Thermoguttaceae bacterium]